MAHLFVTGTDTDVGKTIVSGGLIRMLEGSRRAAYWKPIQTGTLISEDRRDLMQLTELPAERFLPSLHSFPDPVSPHLAAERWKKTIDAQGITAAFADLAPQYQTVIVEGAGGLLVPLNSSTLLIDVILSLRIPALLVVEDRLGGINQGLLSLEALKARDIPCPGFVLTKATGRWGNKEAIERHGHTECLAEFPLHGDARTLIAAVAGNTRLRELMGLPTVDL